MSSPTLVRLSKAEVAAAQAVVAVSHYLRKPVDPRSSVEGFGVFLAGHRVGILLLGRPQAPACYPWYGSVADLVSGRATCSRWQVLNLARVWFDPRVQPGGALYGPDRLPGFHDRRGSFRSILGSSTIALLAERVVLDYLVARPPCFLDEPYELQWLLSYCDTRRHRGVLYRAAGFELWRANATGLQTWRLPLRPLTAEEDHLVRAAALRNPRSIGHRARRAQQDLPLEARA